MDITKYFRKQPKVCNVLLISRYLPTGGCSSPFGGRGQTATFSAVGSHIDYRGAGMGDAVNIFQLNSFHVTALNAFSSDNWLIRVKKAKF